MLREITEEMLAAQKRGPSTVVYTFVRALLDGQWVDTTDDLEGERHTEEYVCPPYAGKDPFLMLTIRRYEDGYEPSFLIGDNLSMTGPKVDTYELAQDWLSEERLVAAVGIGINLLLSGDLTFDATPHGSQPSPEDVVSLIDRLANTLIGVQHLEGSAESWLQLFKDTDDMVQRLRAKAGRDPSAVFPATSPKEP
jgi:hypothetical protein